MDPSKSLALFGVHLVKLRKARQLSQEKLALNSGLARSYVSGIERGQRNVSLVNICVLARTLDVSPSEMLNFSTSEAEMKSPTPKTIARAGRIPKPLDEKRGSESEYPTDLQGL